MQQALPRVEQSGAKPRGWLIILDYVFYIVLIVAVIAFVYYIYTFRTTVSLATPLLLQGTLVTIIISIVSMILATILGFIGALARLSSFAPFRWLATIYVEVIRGTPALVQLLMWYYGIGQLFSQLGFSPYAAAYQFMTGLQSNSLVPDYFNGVFYGILGLSFNYGAYLTEVFRAGIESVDRGQTEAALSLGLNSGQVMRRIILPQAIRITTPPFTNYFITLVQDSSLLATLSVIELEQQTYTIAFPLIDSNTKLFVFIFGALFYLVICYPLTLLSRYLEARMAIAY
jgi:His/Glu/Gln/Arg/opine family amino acid ABC transporter permease subunit